MCKLIKQKSKIMTFAIACKMKKAACGVNAAGYQGWGITRN
jgi:hypothetical protein